MDGGGAEEEQDVRSRELTLIAMRLACDFCARFQLLCILFARLDAGIRNLI